MGNLLDFSHVDQEPACHSEARASRASRGRAEAEGRMREITEIRSLLEAQANIWALHRMTVQGWADLGRIKTEIEQMAENAGKRTIVKLDVRFHQLLYREAQNEQLKGQPRPV